MIAQKNYNIFCYLNKKKQIALTKKNKLGFLNNFYLPEIKGLALNRIFQVGNF